jgi:hypothetical protein
MLDTLDVDVSYMVHRLKYHKPIALRVKHDTATYKTYNGNK